MNWQDLVRRPLLPSADADACAIVRPLLSLMSDGMASAKEVRALEAHLQTCADCRQALLWIEATHNAIVARPAVLPPADMRARIALAIAASAETAVPAVPVSMSTVRRTFRVRPAYAAAASLAVAGAFLGHYLLILGHSSVATVPAAPIYKGKPTPMHSGADQKGTGRAFQAPNLASRHPGPIMATVPPPAHLPKSVPEPSRRTELAASLPPRSPLSVLNTPSLVLASTPPPAPKSGGQRPATNQVALRPTSKLAVPTHITDINPKVATLPKASPAHGGIISPTPILIAPTPATLPVPETIVARAPETTPVRAVPGDALGSVRVSLASYRTNNYARHLSMANGVHQRQDGYFAAIYTPTALSDASASRPSTMAEARPSQSRAAAPVAALDVAPALPASDQRRSEREKQWSDATPSGA